MSAANIFGQDGFFWWVGVVEDRQDPEKIGRCRVRILGYHLDNKEVLPTTGLPWALPMQPITSAAMSGKGAAPVGPLEGTWVIGFFADGKDKQQPVMLGTIAGVPGKTNACTNQEAATAGSDPNVLRDGSGNPIHDSAGRPVQTGIQEAEQNPPAQQAPEGNIEKFIAACKQRGLTDAKYLAAAVANVLKECGGVSKSENLTAYANTSNDRIRTIFPSRVKGKTDAEISAIKTDPVKFGDLIYGYQTDIGRSMGNTDPGDGYKYRGRGFLQLTGKRNYAAASKAIYGDNRLVTNPDLVNQTDVAAQTSAYFLQSTKNSSGTGIAYPGADQNQANILVTSQVAGGDIRNKGAIGREILAKVTAYSKEWVPGTKGGDIIAGNKTPAPPPSTQQANTNQPDPASTPPTERMNDPALGNPKPFSDPNSAYPKCEYTDRPDTNKLATGDTTGTVVQAKIDKRSTAIPRANGKAIWDEPMPAFCSQYPFNHVVESESGHIIEMDDTPQRERLHLYHRAGSYMEIDQNSTRHDHVQGDYYGVYVRNNRVYIKGDFDVTVDNAKSLLVKNTLDLEVWGATTVNLKNDATINIHGKADINVANDLKLKAANIYMEADTDFHIKAGGNAFVDAGETMNLLSGADLALDGSQVHIASGVAAGATETGLETPADKQEPGANTLEDLTRADCDADSEQAGNNDAGENPNPTEGKDPEAVVAGDQLIAQGCKRSDLNAPKIIAPTQYKKGEFNSYREFPATIQLSKNYRLGDLWVGSESAAKCRDFFQTPNARHPSGLSKTEILDNLRGLAVNCLDPIKDRFPNARFTSVLRFDVPAGGSAKSQHLLGQAADIQFNSPSQAYDAALWIRDNVAYDQLLLEYWNKPGGGFTAWVHVSFNPAGNRGAGGAKVGTFMDHQVAGKKEGKPKWYLCDLSK